MNPELIERLLQINRKFYRRSAPSFSRTRSASIPDLEQILPYIEPSARVLDLGCGNGRVAVLLERRRPGGQYVGVDSSSALIDIAQSHFPSGSQSGYGPAFVAADLTQSDWTSLLPRQDRELAGFDCILLLAVLHHIPSENLRARILFQARHLLGPGGVMVVSTWQFLDNERMRRKIAPWSAAGIDPTEVDPGDALLTWKGDGLGLRYCHWIGEGELRQLANQARLQVVRTFRAGGREGNLSLYAVLSPVSSAEQTG